MGHSDDTGTPETKGYTLKRQNFYPKPMAQREFLKRALPAPLSCPSLRGGKARVGDTSNNDARTVRIKQSKILTPQQATFGVR